VPAGPGLGPGAVSRPAALPELARIRDSSIDAQRLTYTLQELPFLHPCVVDVSEPFAKAEMGEAGRIPSDPSTL
jgi:hypothetical protein